MTLHPESLAQRLKCENDKTMSQLKYPPRSAEQSHVMKITYDKQSDDWGLLLAWHIAVK